MMRRLPQISHYRLPPDLTTVKRFHGNACLPFNLSDNMPIESVCLEGLRGESSGNYVLRARVGSDGMSARLPDTSCEVIALRVWYAVPVHDELIVK